MKYLGKKVVHKMLVNLTATQLFDPILESSNWDLFGFQKYFSPIWKPNLVWVLCLKKYASHWVWGITPQESKRNLPQKD